jgi:multiple sugar transport system substrate-binding protein
VVRAYEWIASYSKKLGRKNMNDFRSGFGNFDSPQNAFLAGIVQMEQQGPWMANFIRTLKPDFAHDWAAAAFPSAVPGQTDVTYCGFDTLVIPKGAKHKAEAFEFIAYVNRQEVMEKLCSLHCKPTPLAKVSENFLKNHPNPYITVFERLASSPNAHALPQIPIMPQVFDEMNALSQKISLLDAEPRDALAELQDRLQTRYDTWVEQQRARGSAAR